MDILSEDRSQVFRIQEYLKNESIPDSWTLEISKDDELSLHTNLGKPFFLDFSKRTPLKTHQPLLRAIGNKEKHHSVLDTTAGWGYDAYLLAQANYTVTAVEKNKLVFLFLQSWQKKHVGELKLNFIQEDSFNYLNQIKSQPDVIYIDPMFQSYRKSTSLKSIQILSELNKLDSLNSQGLLNLARQKALHRVVVKRHVKQSKLEGSLLCSFAGQSICFDVFRPSG